MKHHDRRMARPIQVYLDEAELRRLETWSRDRGWTKSQAVRAAIRAVVTRPGDDPLLGLSGMVEGLPPDASASFDTYLEKAFVAPKAKRARARRRRSATGVRR